MAHIKFIECFQVRFRVFVDVFEVFNVNSQIIIRLAVIDMHCHNNTAPTFML